ncbi:MAG: Nif3-like dinuclear metal center hexameric protein, partial [Oscillospiraceae bacterium]
EKCGKTLNSHIRYTEGGKFIQTVAVVGGAGAFLEEAKAAGAQCLVTGDVKHHDGIDAIEMDLPLIGAGHFDTECLVVDYLVEQLTAKFPHLNVMKSEKTQDPFRYLEARG